MNSHTHSLMQQMLRCGITCDTCGIPSNLCVCVCVCMYSEIMCDTRCIFSNLCVCVCVCMYTYTTMNKYLHIYMYLYL